MATVISPKVDFYLEKINRIVAITNSLTFVFVIRILVIILLRSQLNIFVESFSKLLDKFNETLKTGLLKILKRSPACNPCQIKYERDR